jgi:Ca-activated chloride channel family protein
MSGRDFVREIPVDFSSTESHDVLATLWARTRVDELMSRDFNGAQQGTMKDDVKQSIIQLGLDYRLMTQFTSFVAVEEMIVTDGGKPRRVDVPVEVPEGVNREAVFGEEKAPIGLLGRNYGYVVANSPRPARIQEVAKSRKRTGGGGGGAGGSGAGIVGGNTGGAPPPKASPVTIDGVNAADEALRVLSPEDTKRMALQSKFHPSVLAVIDRLKSKGIGNPDEAKFVHSGKAEVQIWFTNKSDAALAELKALGFEVVLDPKTAKMVIGRLPIEKLSALAEIKSIRYVAPQMSN